MDTNDDSDDDSADFDAQVKQVLADGGRDEALRRAYPYRDVAVHTPDTVTAVSAYTGYTGLVLEQQGWRMLFPAQPTLRGAHAGLARVLRMRADEQPGDAGAPWEQAAARVESLREGQVVLDGLVFRIGRVEQTLVLTEYGPQPPLAGDKVFPAAFDERYLDDDEDDGYGADDSVEDDGSDGPE